MSSKKEKITIIGTGNYAVSIAKVFLHYGHEVIFGSRRPNLEYLKESLFEYDEKNFQVLNTVDAWAQSETFVVLAISAEEEIYESFVNKVVQNLSKNKNNRTKIIIEISNTVYSEHKISNAERLENLFREKLSEHSVPAKISIVKAFNLVNSNALSAFVDDPNKNNLSNLEFRIPITGNDEQTKKSVISLFTQVGLTAYDYGDLVESLNLERANISTFSEWKQPCIISFGFFLFNFIWVFLIYFYFPKKPHTFYEYLKDFTLLSHLNKVLGFTTLNLLAYVYFAYVVASIYQLCSGTKYQRFPKYLDTWLKSRKQVGLLTFLLGSFHAMASIYVTNPQYLKDWHIKLANNAVGRMTLNGELNIITGIIAYLLMVIIALTSINSIANSLNWSEWRFVQSKMGIACLAMGFVHDALMYFRIYNEKDEFNYSFVYLITRVKLIALYFPFIVLLSRFILGYFTPISNRLDKIRNGTIVKNSSKNN